MAAIIRGAVMLTLVEAGEHEGATHVLGRKRQVKNLVVSSRETSAIVARADVA